MIPRRVPLKPVSDKRLAGLPPGVFAVPLRRARITASRTGNFPAAESRVQAARKNAGGKNAARKPIKAVSDKRARENRERRAMAVRQFPGMDPDCSVKDCPRPADDLHEALTRARGGSITDEENTFPVCRQHNEELTLEPAWGYEQGLLKHSWDANGSDAA